MSLLTNMAKTLNFLGTPLCPPHLPETINLTQEPI
jgi:hypothetical protein